VRENAHNFYKTFTHSLRNRYDFPRPRGVFFRVSVRTHLMTGLARELFEGNPRQSLLSGSRSLHHQEYRIFPGLGNFHSPGCI